MSERRYDPRLPADVWLDAFADWPAEARPVLTHRRTNAAEWATIADALDVMEGKPLAEATAGVFAALRLGLVDWRNQMDPSTGEAVAFDAAKLECVLSPIEAIELLVKRRNGGQLTRADRKNSDSPASSNAAG